MSRAHDDIDAQRVVDAAYRELWSQIEDGRGTVADGSRALSDTLGDGAEDGWYEWLAAETEWTAEDAEYDDEDSDDVDDDDD